MKKFVNRTTELKKLEHARKSGGGLTVLYGRRRVGKTALLTRWLSGHKAIYSQAIEANAELQLEQLVDDISTQFGFVVPPRDWLQLFKLLQSAEGPWILCLDEFQYLVQSSPELPSLMQRFLDHSMPKGASIVIAGSSQSLMHGLVMDNSAPLFGRSELLLKVMPMEFKDFCDALALAPKDIDALLLYSLTGGLPRYWNTLDRLDSRDPVQVAEKLYFEGGAPMEDEPDRILKDEGSIGKTARSILEAIGRGSHRLSEIAGRLGQPATNLTRPIKMLLDLGFICRDLPFGASERESKSSYYRLADPVLQFWFSIYSPMRTRWFNLKPAAKLELLHTHTGHVLEQLVRSHYQGASKYWEKSLEWDVVREVAPRSIVITEIKFGKLNTQERQRIKKKIQDQFTSSSLAQRYRLEDIEILDINDAATLLTHTPKL